MNDKLIETIGLKKYFKTRIGDLHAVDDVNISIEEGRTLGVVGESGCGKSTLGRVMLRLIEPTAGEVRYRGENIFTFSKTQMMEMRKKAQIIFQDPYSSLNPRMSVFEIIAEPIKVQRTIRNKNEMQSKVFELMETVALSQRYVNAYPHELDGGRRQRIGVARALALNPEFIVCDEPVSALDVSIQAQILNLMMDLQSNMKLTYLFITHDLSVVKHISDDIAVMYLGQCIEKAPKTLLFSNPLHPYTKALLAAIPLPSIKAEDRLTDIIQGEVSSPIEPKPGCRFASRCRFACPNCYGENIYLQEVEREHWVSCALYST